MTDYGNIQSRYIWDRENLSTINLNEKVMELIGKGIRYPFQFDELVGKIKEVETSKGLDKINGSIFHILATSIGSRFFNPEFGSMLPSLVFEPYDEIFQSKVLLYTIEALKRWEPRINVISLGFDESLIDQNQVGIGIQYQVINTAVTNLYVYPFKLGTAPVT